MMSVAYNSKNLSFPLIILKNLLFYDFIEQPRTDCAYYGLKVTETEVRFVKTDFDDNICTVSY